MGKKTRTRPSAPSTRKKRGGYTPGEWFMVALGLSLVVLVLGIIVTSVLGE